MSTTAVGLRPEVRLRPAVVVVVAPAGAAPVRRRSARAGLLWFAAGVVFLHAVAVLLMDVVRPQVRDPEYGVRAARLRARAAEHPHRPLVIVVGGSRAAMGVRPGAWEAARPGMPQDPLLFNMATVGAGPVQQLMTLRRVFDDGFRPAVVLIEYWPPFLRQDGVFGESHRADPRRLRLSERDLVREYFPNARETERRMWATRVNVFAESRERLVVQVAPNWVTKTWRIDGPWAELDAWGWLPGMDPDPDDEAFRARMVAHYRDEYRARFAGFTIAPESDRGLRASVALARAHGASVGFVYLPESATFRAWYPPDAEAMARAHLAGLSDDMGVPVLDCRAWMDDRLLVDGFHLSRRGAAEFTARLGAAVAAQFPAEGGQP